MRRSAAIALAFLVVVAGVSSVVAAATVADGSSPGAAGPPTGAVAAAETNASKAAVVARETEDARGQLTDLHERRETLRARYQSGEITPGEYRSTLARIAAQIRTLERRLNTSATVAADLPPETLRGNGDGNDTDGETGAETESDAGRLSGSTAAPNLIWYGGGSRTLGTIPTADPPGRPPSRNL
jgi:Spy/CpxP family protein refolding chaperone